MQNGIVPAVLPLAAVQTLWRQLRETRARRSPWDLSAQNREPGRTARLYGFEIDATRKERLMKGLDDVGVTLTHLPRSKAFEKILPREEPGLADRYENHEEICALCCYCTRVHIPAIGCAQAQGWKPEKPVELVVGASCGRANDPSALVSNACSRT